MMNGCYKSFCNSNLDFLLSTLNPPPRPPRGSNYTDPWEYKHL